MINEEIKRRISEHESSVKKELSKKLIREIEEGEEESYAYLKLYKPHLLDFRHKSPFTDTAIKAAGKLKVPFYFLI